jgi:hypothetical protein
MMNTTNPAAMYSFLTSPARCSCSGYDLENYGHHCRAYAYGYRALENNWEIAGKLAALYPALTGLRALALVGAAVEAALRPGLALTAFALHMSEIYSTIVKGRWVRISGSRGNAKAHTGKVGKVVWVGESRHGGAYYNHRVGYLGGSVSERVGVKVEGEEKPVYVNLKHVEPIALPPAAIAEAQAKAVYRIVRPEFTGSKGDMALVVGGPHRGARGRVFWTGVKSEGLRLGLKTCTHAKRCMCEALWISGRDAVRVQAWVPASRVVDGTTISDAEIVEATLEVLQTVDGSDDVVESWIALGRAIRDAA